MGPYLFSHVICCIPVGVIGLELGVIVTPKPAYHRLMLTQPEMIKSLPLLLGVSSRVENKRKNI